MTAFVPGFEHDVFVSYAHVDNVSLSEDPKEGWVYRLKNHLKTLLSKKLGRSEQGDIWIDLRLTGNEPFPDKISEAVQRSAVLLVILSEGYLASDWCRQERELFLEAAAGKALEEGRIFLVRLTDLEHDRWPEPFHDLLGYPFFTKDREEDSARMLGWPYADPKKEQDRPYFQRLDDLSGALEKRLRVMEKAAAGKASGTVDKTEDGAVSGDGYPINIFLAETTPDLDRFRDDIKRHLGQEQIGVLPDAFYERTPVAFQTAMEVDLPQSLLFVQLLGPFMTRTTPDLPTGYEGLQLDVARNAGKPILRWRDPDLNLSTVQNPELFTKEDVMAMPFEEFKGKVVNEVRRLALRQDKPEVILGNPFTLVRVDSGDKAIADRIAGIFEEYQIDFDIVEDDQEFIDLVEDKEYPTDGLMVVYGNCERSWVRGQLRTCRKVTMRKRHNPPVCAVYVGSRPRASIGMHFAGLHVLTGMEGELKTPDLGGFFQAVQTRARMSRMGLSL